MNLKNLIRDLLQSILPGEAVKDLREDQYTGQLFKHATYQKHSGKRHRPYTKAPYNEEKSKKRRKMAAMSRRINR